MLKNQNSSFKKSWRRLLAVTTSLSLLNFAQAEPDAKYYEIGSIKIVSKDVTIDTTAKDREICTDCFAAEYSIKDWNQRQKIEQDRREDLLKKFGMKSEGGDISFEQIINYGVKLWKLIEAGKPVVKFEGMQANALPANLNGDWMALENWQAPKGRVYSVTYKNVYGMEVVRFDYRLLFSSGGSYNEKGQYISNVNVNAQNLWVAWGYNVEAQAKVVNVVNTASKANPVAGMEVLVDWKVKTVVRDMRSSTSFFVKGSGDFMDLNGENI